MVYWNEMLKKKKKKKIKKYYKDIAILNSCDIIIVVH